ncbi:unnamed protein product [Alopecurus aequalis]
MARLPTTTIACLFAVAFFLAGATAAEDHGNKVAASTTVSVPLHPADYLILAQGRNRKLTGGAVSAMQACEALEGNRRACYTMAKLPGVTTPRALLDAALRVALGRARALKAKFDEAKATSKKGNPMASILGSCDKNYDDLVSALEEASRALHKGGSSYNLVTKMSAASTYATDCDNWFSERSLTSPYESVQRHAAQAVSVALGVAAKNNNL